MVGGVDQSTKGHERSSGSVGYVFYLDFGGNLHNVMCLWKQNYELQRMSLL